MPDPTAPEAREVAARNAQHFSRVSRVRLSAPERRAALVATACRVFSEGSYRGTTTAEIAREAGITEPILYRHFESKRELYLECFRNTWERVRETWEQVLEDEPDPANWVSAMGRAYVRLQSEDAAIATLWLQSLAEASDDPEICSFTRAHMREVHDFVTGVMRRAQEAGGIPRDRDPEAEAWIFIGVGLLLTVDQRLGDLLTDDFERVVASRRRWLTGRD